ncbi:MAG: 3-dehydroquinate synthase family protein [Acidobacteriota bacterium]
MTALARLELTASGATSAITAGPDALVAQTASLADWVGGGTLFIVSAQPIRALHDARLDPLRRAIASNGGRCVELDVPDGEPAKDDVGEASRLWNAMLAAGGRRDSRLLTFGGGTVGDLGGFVAGCFLRGIAYAQVPTTLLAQVDAAIGGKTGVDLAGGKNTVGLFHQPVQVVADTHVLTTLDRDLLRAGLVEAIKMAYLLDLDLLARIERDLDLLLAGDVAALAPVVQGAAKAKVDVVLQDEREGNLRRVLNFGHTLGHAIEADLGYADLSHGDAVAWGLRFALRLSRRRALPRADADRLFDLIDRLGVPNLPPSVRAPTAVDRLLDLMQNDKKATLRGLVWVLAKMAGTHEMADDVAPDAVRAELAAFLAEPTARA